MATVGAAALAATALTAFDLVLGRRQLPLPVPLAAAPWVLLLDSCVLLGAVVPFMLAWACVRAGGRRRWLGLVLPGAVLSPLVWKLAEPPFAGPWVSTTALGTIGPPVTTLLVVVGLGVILAWTRLGLERPHAWGRLALLSGACAGYFVNYKLLRGYHAAGETLLALMTAIAGTGFVLSQCYRSRRRLLLLAAAPMLLVLPGALLASPPPSVVRKLAVGQTFASKSFRAVRLVDLDGDGQSTLVGGADCNDFNARVHMLAFDVPNNGIDEDCWGGDARSSIPPPTPMSITLSAPAVAKVLVISVDALRSDSLVAFMASGRAGPALSAAWSGACLATEGYAAGSHTLASFRQMLWPRRGTPSWPTAATAAGVSTTMVSVPRLVSYCDADFPLRAQFSRVITVGAPDVRNLLGATKPSSSTPAITAAACTELGAGPARQILWTHYFDLHEYARLETAVAANLVGGERYQAKYAAALESVLHGVDQLIAAARSLSEPVAVVFLADHGQGLQLHGPERLGHGYSTSEHLIRMPLFVWRSDGDCRGWPAADLVAHRLASRDLGRIVLTLAGVPVPPGYPQPGRPPVAVSFASSGQTAIIDWPWKLVVSTLLGGVELFNVEVDPKQQRDLASTRPDLIERLLGQLEAGLPHPNHH